MANDLSSITLDELDDVSGGADKATARPQARKPADKRPISLDATNGLGGYIAEDLGFGNPDDTGKFQNGTRASRKTLENAGKILSGGRR